MSTLKMMFRRKYERNRRLINQSFGTGTDPLIFVFFCVGVVYSGECDVCDVTLSAYPHRARLKQNKSYY